jgi:hypothetical protein
MDEYEEQIKRKKVYQTEWYQQNKERLNTKAQQYYVDNKARLKKESVQLVCCPLCGTCVRKGSLSHHKRTEKCKELRAMRIIYNTLNK